MITASKMAEIIKIKELLKKLEDKLYDLPKDYEGKLLVAEDLKSIRHKVAELINEVHQAVILQLELEDKKKGESETFTFEFYQKGKRVWDKHQLIETAEIINLSVAELVGCLYSGFQLSTKALKGLGVKGETVIATTSLYQEEEGKNLVVRLKETNKEEK